MDDRRRRRDGPRSCQRGMLVWALASAFAGAPRLARATQLELNDAAACTSLDELSHRVSRALGQPLEREDGRRFVVDMHRDARGFHARLETSSSGSPRAPALRQLNAASCDGIVDALALAIALASSS